MDYQAVHITLSKSEDADLLTGFLSMAGFEGFEERANLLIAYTEELNFPDKALLESLLKDYVYEIHAVPAINWNQQWESNFQPVRIDDFCGIRAHFHPPLQDVMHEIIITPRMTFGTGHHATTTSMIRLMQKLDLRGKSVLDFGTGTGILAILAAKMGATDLIAIDNDPMAVENARENFLVNAITQIEVVCTDQPDLPRERFDLILANINRHVIYQYWRELLILLKPDGVILLSGILQSDHTFLTDLMKQKDMRIVQEINCGEWLSVQAEKNSFEFRVKD